MNSEGKREDAGLPGNFKVKIIDLETGDYTVSLNGADANIMGLRSLDRVRVSVGDRKMVAIVELTDSVVPEGSVGILRRGKALLEG